MNDNITRVLDTPSRYPSGGQPWPLHVELRTRWTQDPRPSDDIHIILSWDVQGASCSTLWNLQDFQNCAAGIALCVSSRRVRRSASLASVVDCRRKTSGVGGDSVHLIFIHCECCSALLLPQASSGWRRASTRTNDAQSSTTDAHSPLARDLLPIVLASSHIDIPHRRQP